MGRLLLILFIVVPIVEIALFIEIGGWIGLWPTLGLIVATAVIGSLLLRRQGLTMLMTIRDKLNRGEAPRRELIEGVFLVLAGALLLTPGFFTDVVGFLLLVPILRGWAADRLLAMADVRQAGGPTGRGGTGRGEADGVIIDVDDYVVREEDDERRRADRAEGRRRLDRPEEPDPRRSGDSPWRRPGNPGDRR